MSLIDVSQLDIQAQVKAKVKDLQSQVVKL